MKAKSPIAVLFVIFVLVACTPATISEVKLTATKVVVAPTATATDLIPTITTTPIKPTMTVTPALPPREVLIYDPFKMVPDLPVGERPKDALLFTSVDVSSFILHFDPMIHAEALPKSTEAGCVSTSPDGKWLAFCPLSKDSPTGQWLIVESYDLKQQRKVPMDMGLIYFDNNWLDSQRLIFPLIGTAKTDQPRPYSMVVINPFTGSQQELSSNYPDLRLSPAGSKYSLEFGSSDVVYDPSLSLVVYPEYGLKAYYVLWDRQRGSVLAKVEDRYVAQYPLWSSDGKQLAIVVDGNKDLKKFHQDDWFRVSREGQVERLTHFADYFQTAEIGAANWSPDGQKLAFWLGTDPGLCMGQNLAILDVQTHQVIDTCIPGLPNVFQSPVWSLDSRFVAILSMEKDNSTRIILVDIEKGSAYQIPDIVDGRPAGWLVEAP
jgi:Tol biopolymer transport system component